MNSSEEPIVVAGPARAETVALLRAIAASVAARRDMDVVAIEEFRIAVDEAATLLLLGGAATRLEMSLLPTADAGVEVRVRTDVDAVGLPSGPRDLMALARDPAAHQRAELSVEDSGAQVAFVVGEGPGA